MKLSERLARLGTETAFEVLVRARALEAKGKSIIHLEIGEPDFDTPAHITEAAVEALKSDAHLDFALPVPAVGGCDVEVVQAPVERIPEARVAAVLIIMAQGQSRKADHRNLLARATELTPR